MGKTAKTKQADLFAEPARGRSTARGRSGRSSRAPAGGGDAGYTARHIEVLEGLEPVRRRPGMYIGGTDEKALHHLFAEAIDNAMDEALAGHATFIEVELTDDGFLMVSDNGRGIPVDPHPKFPKKSALEIIMVARKRYPLASWAYAALDLVRAGLFVAPVLVFPGLSGLLAGRIPLIGVGGILSGADARAKTAAGASLVQVYTGFIYRGPGLVAEARRALR